MAKMLSLEILFFATVFHFSICLDLFSQSFKYAFWYLDEPKTLKNVFEHTNENELSSLRIIIPGTFLIHLIDQIA